MRSSTVKKSRAVSRNSSRDRPAILASSTKPFTTSSISRRPTWSAAVTARCSRATSTTFARVFAPAAAVGEAIHVSPPLVPARGGLAYRDRDDRRNADAVEYPRLSAREQPTAVETWFAGIARSGGDPGRGQNRRQSGTEHPADPRRRASVMGRSLSRLPRQ